MADIASNFIQFDQAQVNSLMLWHEEQAAGLRARAAALLEIERRQQAAACRVEYIAQAVPLVLAYLAKGYNSLQAAQDAAARDLDLPAFTVAAQWRAYSRRRDQAARAQRDETIMRLVRLGLRNSDIAARLGCHANTVSRAISAALFPALRPCDRARLRKRRILKTDKNPPTITTP